MESLEHRMERLTPEQRREVEDFVDFLLLKNNFSQTSPAPSIPSPVLMNAPPVLSAEPSSQAQLSVPRMQDMIVHEEPHLPAVCPDHESSGIHEITDTSDDGYMDYGMFEQGTAPAPEGMKSPKRRIIARDQDEKSGHLLDWVD